MSGNETAHSSVSGTDNMLNHDVLAFEYVTGVMRGEEREQFERLMQSDENLAAQVNFWEEQLMQLSPAESRAPSSDVWQQIKTQLNNGDDIQSRRSEPFWQRWILFASSSIAAIIIASLLFIFPPYAANNGPNADYVAVLTDANGAPRLTVLTAPKGAKLWLKWDNLVIANDKNLQLWAVSKRDGQVRPLGVFTKSDITQYELTIANYRLIKDAETLLLTEEDIGGSALDEPSDKVLAKGVCVLLAQTKT